MLSYNFDRMVVEFTLLNQGKAILCAISTAAMDDLEGRRDVKPDERVGQFMRLRDVMKDGVRESSSRSRARPTDRWYCDLMISQDSPFDRSRHSH